MIATFTALLFAHVLADFVFQTEWMVIHKRRPRVLLLHAVIVLVLSQAALGQVAAPLVLALAAAHLVIDAGKTLAAARWGGARGLAAFLIDQAAHLASIAAVAVLAPALWATGLWAGLTGPAGLPPPPVLALHLALLVAGLIAATRAGGFAVGMLMKRHGQAPGLPEGLAGGGLTIGLLERGLIFLLVLTGQPAGIGFLIAAKSILRFGTVAENRAASEYVIIGTLASFGWALLVAYATQGLLAALPPLAP